MKSIYRIITFTFVTISGLYPQMDTIFLPNGIWKFVGYKGIYFSTTNPRSWDSDRHNTIIDVADEKTTYIVPNSTQDDHLYNYVGGATASVNLTANTFTTNRLFHRDICYQRRQITQTE